MTEAKIYGLARKFLLTSLSIRLILDFLASQTTALTIVSLSASNLSGIEK